MKMLWKKINSKEVILIQVGKRVIKFSNKKELQNYLRAVS